MLPKFSFVLRSLFELESWGNGIQYDKSKTDLLLQGSNQIWYHFKQVLKEHVNCSSKRSGGQMHLKAKQFAVSMKKKETECINTNANVVAAALETCKMKSAALSFESLLALVSFCGSEIGNIGHGRWVRNFYYIYSHPKCNIYVSL